MVQVRRPAYLQFGQLKSALTWRRAGLSRCGPSLKGAPVAHPVPGEYLRRLHDAFLMQFDFPLRFNTFNMRPSTATTNFGICQLDHFILKVRQQLAAIGAIWFHNCT